MSGGKKKIVWKNVKVPEEVHAALKQKAKQENTAMHKIISSLLIASENIDLAEASGKLLAASKNVDKALWYCLKLVNGIAMYKQALKISNMIDAAEGEQIAEYTKSQYEKLMNTLDQIEKRLRVDMDEVRDAIKEMEANVDGKTTAKLNDTVKKAMLGIINKVVV